MAVPKQRLPSLRGLQAFDAIARLGNLAASAHSLGITPSAISHRIRGLEQELGVNLLRRTSNGLRLTEAGRRYRSDVEDAFAQLARATNDLLGADFSQPLTISLTSEFGARWLMPRFHRFMDLHTDIETTIQSSHRIADLMTGEADVALRYGNGNWPGLKADPILSFSVTPLCSPSAKNEIDGLAPTEALTKIAMIRDVDDSHDDWDTWLRAAGTHRALPGRVLRFEEYSMAMKAAISGQGMVLGYCGYIESEISAGLLVRPFDLIVPIERGYHLVYLEKRLADPRVRAFRDWVISETEVAGVDLILGGTTALGFP